MILDVLRGLGHLPKDTLSGRSKTPKTSLRLQARSGQPVVKVVVVGENERSAFYLHPATWLLVSPTGVVHRVIDKPALATPLATLPGARG